MRRYLQRIKRRLVPLLTFALLYSGALWILNPFVNRYRLARRRLTLVRRRRSNSFQILLYHRIDDGGDAFLASTPTRLFKRQMEYLAENSAVWPLEDAVEAMLSDDLPDNVVVITFDDGYRDNYVHAFPTLTDLSLTATIFLATDCIGSRRILWHDRVFRAFSNTGATSLEEFGPHRKSYFIGTVRERTRARTELLEMLKGLTEEDRTLWIDRLIDRLAVEDPREVPDLMMNWDEVREMQRSGMSFGSHTATHPILSTLSMARVEDEITKSKAAIEQELRVPIKTFAYPNGRRGDFTEQTKELLRQTGYTCAVTTIFGANGGDSAVPDLMELKRDMVWSKTHHEFAARLAFNKFAS